MTRFPFLKMALIGVVCAGLVTACGRRGQGNLTVTTQAPAPTYAAQPTNLPPATQPVQARATAAPTLAPTPTTVSQSDAPADAVEESLQQADTALSSTDTADDLQDNAQEDAAGQALQQLGDDLGNTDTLTDLPGQ